MQQFPLLFLLFLLLNSCEFFSEKNPEEAEKAEEEYFYSSKKDGDLWRVPLVRPYEMVSPMNSNLNDWYLSVDHPNITGPGYNPSSTEFQFGGVYHIGIRDSIIRLDNENDHWPTFAGMYPTTLLINTKTHELFIARTKENKKELDDQLRAWGIAGEMNMHFWDEVKDSYQKTGKLPTNW